MQNSCEYLKLFIFYIMILDKEFLNLINKICENYHWVTHNYKSYFYILITKLIFIVSYYFIIKKIIIKCNFIKVSSNLSKTCTSTILSSVKSSIKSTTFLLIYYNFFIFNAVIKNKKTILKYYKKKIVMSLLEVICSLTLNTCKTIIIDLEMSL